jgi:hypothetical protein
MRIKEALTPQFNFQSIFTKRSIHFFKEGSSMQKENSGHFNKQRKYFLVLICLLCFSLVGISASVVPSAHAASRESDPMVAIVVDATPKGCTQRIVTQRAGTSNHQTVTRACPSGTFLKTQLIRLSVAQAHHDKYVALPLPGASRAELQRASTAMNQLRAQLRPTPSVKPLACYDGGATTNLYTTANIGSGTLIAMNVNYYISGDCSSIFLDNIVEQGDNVPNDFYYADVDFYASDSFTWSTITGCPSVNNHYSISRSLNRTEPYGDYYVAGWLNPGTLGYCGSSFLEDQYSVLLN